MAFDARMEDYQRLALCYERASGATDSFDALRAMGSFQRKFEANRDALPQTDADRAFHLVQRATKLVDYQVPFAIDATESGDFIETAGHMLAEARDLDPRCYDAQRMFSAMYDANYEDSFRMLVEREDEVYRICKELSQSAKKGLNSPRSQQLAAHLAMMPSWRWQATLADKALVSGRYKLCCKLCERLWERDPADNADIYRTWALALAKLQDGAELAHLASRMRRKGIFMPEAWLSLSQIYVAWADRKLERAESLVDALIGSYPHAALALMRQVEIADGVFARIRVMPRSEDELVLGISEATVLLQEAQDERGRGGLGAWISRLDRLSDELKADKRVGFFEIMGGPSEGEQNDGR